MKGAKFEGRKKALERFIKGHKNADELLIAEKRIRLSKLTVEDSLREYDALCNVWKANPNKEGMERLKRQRISFLVERRRLFDKAGKALGRR